MSDGPNPDNPNQPNGMEPVLGGQPEESNLPMLGGKRGETLRRYAQMGLPEARALNFLLMRPEGERPSFTPCVFLRQLGPHATGVGNYSLEAVVAKEKDVLTDDTSFTLAAIGPRTGAGGEERISVVYMFDVNVQNKKLFVWPLSHAHYEDPAQVLVGIWALKALASRVYMPLELTIPEARAADGTVRQSYQLIRAVLDGRDLEDTLLHPDAVPPDIDQPKTYEYDATQLVLYQGSNLRSFRPLREWSSSWQEMIT